MHIQFVKLIQFSLLVKAGGRLREFNFRKLRGPEQEEFAVNVCNERGDRIFFNMQKKDNDWKIISEGLPPWVIQNEKGLRQAMDEELQNW